jgi:hypothetical protein
MKFTGNESMGSFMISFNNKCSHGTNVRIFELSSLLAKPQQQLSRSLVLSL